MKQFILYIVFFVLIIFCHCSKDNPRNVTIIEENGVKVYQNQDKPSQNHLEISPREVFSIKGIDTNSNDKTREFTWPRFLDIDSKSNIYILDFPSASVKKFSKNGEFIKSFGRKGNGPGEMNSPYMLAVLNDIVYVTDPGVLRMVKFDTEGNFKGNIQLKEGLPNFLQPVGKDKFIAFILDHKRVNDEVYQHFDLVLTNELFERIAVLNRYKKKYDPFKNTLLDRFSAYAIGEDKIFVAKNSTSAYRIKVFDFTGKLVYQITREYNKILFSKDELVELNSTLESFYKKVSPNRFPLITEKYKKAINMMFIDKYGRLLAASSVERNKSNRYDFLVDVFKDGVFLNKVKLDIFKGYDFLKLQDEKIFFKGNRIYHINEPDAVVKVFTY